MKRLIAIAALLLLAAPVLADSMDDAEAKRRGVAVEVVQLERARKDVADLRGQVKELATKNAELQKQADAATKELAALKASMTPAQVAATKSAEDKAKDIAEAVKNKQLLIGMTLTEATKAMEGICKPELTSQSNDETEYAWKIHGPGNGRPDIVLSQTVTQFRNGKITAIQKY